MAVGKQSMRLPLLLPLRLLPRTASKQTNKFCWTTIGLFAPKKAPICMTPAYITAF